MKKFFVAALSALFLLPSNYAYADPIPVLSSISPISGDIDGGNTVTLNGSDFTESTVIKVAGTVVPDTLVSSTQITIVMPPRAAGFVSISAFSGMVGAVLPNAYEYVDIPDPSPTPTPTPTTTETSTPSPTPTATLSPSPTPSASLTPSATPTSSVTIAPAPVSAGSGGSGATTISSQQDYVITQTSPMPTETVLPAVSIVDNFPVYNFGNGLTVYTNASFMNVRLDNFPSKRMRFTLQQRTATGWKTIDVAWKNRDGDVIFYGVKLSNGSYRIVNAAKPIRWFRIG